MVVKNPLKQSATLSLSDVAVPSIIRVLFVVFVLSLLFCPRCFKVFHSCEGLFLFSAIDSLKKFTLAFLTS